MVFRSQGLLCGLEFAPQISYFDNSKGKHLAKVEFCVLCTREGNIRKNFDMYVVKIFDNSETNRPATKFFEAITTKDGKFKDEFQGKTISFQYSLENELKKDSSGRWRNYSELIATYISLNPGIELVFTDDIPECAKKKTQTQLNNVIPYEEVSQHMEQKATPTPVEEEVKAIENEEQKVKTSTNEVVDREKEIKPIPRCVAPIGCLDSIRELKGAPKKVSMLANDESYQSFRQLMG